MEAYKSTMRVLYATFFALGPKTSSTKFSNLQDISKNKSIDNEYVLSPEYLREEAYHGSSISHKFAQFLLWSFVSILITPILIILAQLRSSNYFWFEFTGVIICITLIISYFHHSQKGVEENYTAAWEAKTRSVAKTIQDRIYAKDQKTKFRTTHLARVHFLQSIPENQTPKSMSGMRHEMSEKYTAAMKDMTSETRVMLNIYVLLPISFSILYFFLFTLHPSKAPQLTCNQLFISGAISIVFLWASYYYFHHPRSIYEATNYLLLASKGVVVMVMYGSVLHQTKFWIEELERERRGIMRGWDIVN